MTFSDQYKHPNWQKKRLEALESASFICQLCGSGEDTLHVHHKRYIKGRKVWDYQVEELFVLCECCHAETHRVKEALNSILAALHPEGFSDVVALIAGYCSNVQGPAYVDLNDVDSYIDLSFPAFAAGVFAAKELPDICKKIAESKRGGK